MIKLALSFVGVSVGRTSKNEVDKPFNLFLGIGEEEPSGSSTPPQLKGWDGSPSRNKKDMELSQRPGYAL